MAKLIYIHIHINEMGIGLTCYINIGLKIYIKEKGYFAYRHNKIIWHVMTSDYLMGSCEDESRIQYSTLESSFGIDISKIWPLQFFGWKDLPFLHPQIIRKVATWSHKKSIYCQKMQPQFKSYMCLKTIKMHVKIRFFNI